jgi:hypothetical protein
MMTGTERKARFVVIRTRSATLWHSVDVPAVAMVEKAN